MSKKVILAGGSGLLGRALAQRLASMGWEVVGLSRQPRVNAAFREVHWDGESPGPWMQELEGADALVNLAGRNLNCVFTPGNSHEILASRVDAVRALGSAVAQCKSPPRVWVQCSAVGYYGDDPSGVCDENSPPGRDFLAGVCRQWEQAFAAAVLPATRRVVLRLGVVLSPHGGAYPPLARLTRFFLGGAAGRGRQGISWVHEDDAVAIFCDALQRPELAGTFNACAPAPASNAAFMRSLRAALGRPWVPPAPALVVRFVARHLMGTDPALVLGGQNCVPCRLQAQGFKFKFADLGVALRDLAESKP